MTNIKNYLKIMGKEVKAAFTENKYIILIVAAIFIITALIGFFFAANLQTLMNPVVQTFQQRISSGQVTLTTHSLYYNNVIATLTIYCGSLLMGVFGILAIIVNALLIGFYAAIYNAHNQIILYLLLILPHGIFEIPALVIASSGGFVMLAFIIKFLINLISPDYTYTEIFDPVYNQDKITLKETLKMSWRKNGKMFKQSIILLIVAVVLLMIAAFVEANITKPLAFTIFKYFFGSV